MRNSLLLSSLMLILGGMAILMLGPVHFRAANALLFSSSFTALFFLTSALLSDVYNWFNHLPNPVYSPPWGRFFQPTTYHFMPFFHWRAPILPQPQIASPLIRMSHSQAKSTPVFAGQIKKTATLFKPATNLRIKRAPLPIITPIFTHSTQVRPNTRFVSSRFVPRR